MTELQDKLEQLEADYQTLLSIYQTIAAHSQEEANWIKNNEMESLLNFLQVKEQLMLNAEKYQKRIRQNQQLLVEHYKLGNFSIPRLLEKVVPKERERLVNLQELIKQLIEQLSDLEKQEKELESMLREYTITIQSQKIKKQDHYAAKRAYSRVPKPD